VPRNFAFGPSHSPHDPRPTGIHPAACPDSNWTVQVESVGFACAERIRRRVGVAGSRIPLREVSTYPLRVVDDRAVKTVIGLSVQE